MNTAPPAACLPVCLPVVAACSSLPAQRAPPLIRRGIVTMMRGVSVMLAPVPVVLRAAAMVRARQRVAVRVVACPEVGEPVTAHVHPIHRVAAPHPRLVEQVVLVLLGAEGAHAVALLVVHQPRGQRRDVVVVEHHKALGVVHRRHVRERRVRHDKHVGRHHRVHRHQRVLVQLEHHVGVRPGQDREVLGVALAEGHDVQPRADAGRHARLEPVQHLDVPRQRREPVPVVLELNLVVGAAHVSAPDVHHDVDEVGQVEGHGLGRPPVLGADLALVLRPARRQALPVGVHALVDAAHRQVLGLSLHHAHLPVAKVEVAVERAHVRGPGVLDAERRVRAAVRLDVLVGHHREVDVRLALQPRVEEGHDAALNLGAQPI
mmetsp:Transcript_2050/g.5222  ORF Transcript_2050/g.5222 Transcript_2050/m.5222 type:complete len:376 (+) Transcript_2050:262-1389(+)